MSTRRTFTNEFKRQVVEEILSGGTTTAAACRKYAIAYPVVSRWKKAYSLGRLDNEPTTDEGYQEKIAQLERKVGQLTMENDVLKKVLKQTQSQRARSAPIYPITFPHSEASGGGAKQ
jgi:transposase-like protein